MLKHIRTQLTTQEIRSPRQRIKWMSRILKHNYNLFVPSTFVITSWQHPVWYNIMQSDYTTVSFGGSDLGAFAIPPEVSSSQLGEREREEDVLTGAIGKKNTRRLNGHFIVRVFW